MAISLQEQLLKAGVASKKQANKAKSDKRKAKKTPKTPTPDTSAQAQQLLAKKEKDKQLNLEREQLKQKKANQAQARQIVDSNKIIIDKEADIAHQFAHMNFIKTIYVDKKIQQQLFVGLLTVVFMDDKYYLIPTSQAHRLVALEPDWVVQLPEKEQIDEDDPYADYEIPDDLMW